jgi:hypothetical protein
MEISSIPSLIIICIWLILAAGNYQCLSFGDFSTDGWGQPTTDDPPARHLDQVAVA